MSAQETYDPGADSVALWDKVELLSSTEQTERRLYFLLAASRGSNPSVSDLPSLPMDVRRGPDCPIEVRVPPHFTGPIQVLPGSGAGLSQISAVHRVLSGMHHLI